MPFSVLLSSRQSREIRQIAPFAILQIQKGVFVMEMPGLPLGSRRDEDIALDLMKFVAMTTGYGKTTGTGVGFQGTGAAAKPEDYAAQLLELYGRCLKSVGGK
jgi:hypothetical protein